MTTHPVSPAARDDELPMTIYSSPGSRWVDPALGCKWPSNMPLLHEVLWPIGSADVQCGDSALTEQPEVTLLRVLAVYIGSLHGARRGTVRYHYYSKKAAPGYVKIDANGEFIAVGFDLRRLNAAEIFGELYRIRTMQMLVRSAPMDNVSFVPIVLFGVEGDIAFYVESMYGVPEANAYFNSRSLEFLARYSTMMSLRAPSTLDEQMEYLNFEPMLEKQIDECPPELRPSFVQQVMANIQGRLIT